MPENSEKKTFIIDIDGTICTQDGANYEFAQPITEMITVGNGLFDLGHEVIYFTARGSKTGIDWTELTQKQLQSWGVKHTKLIMGKPYGDFYVDDKAMTLENFKTLRTQFIND